MAHLQKQGKRWTIRFRLNGKRYRITVGFDKKSADQILKRLEARLVEIDLGLRTIASGGLVHTLLNDTGVNRQQTATLAEAISSYLNDSAVAENTLRNYRHHHKLLLSFYGPGTTLRGIDIGAYVKHRRKDVSDNTIRKELVTLSNLFKAACIEDQLIPRLQVDKRKQFRSLANSSDGRCALLTKEEVNELRFVVRENGSELIADSVDLIAFTGIRRSEICRLLPEHVDLVNGYILVTEKKRVHGQTTHRRIPIHKDIVEVLQRRGGRTPVFTSSTSTLSSGFRRAVKGTRFDKHGIGFHVLRHSIASRLLSKGVPVSAVAAILGHSTPKTTFDLYAHAFEKDITEGIDQL
jgi:integrase